MYASNGELIDYLKREKQQGRIVVWRKLREIAAGLSYLHERGIVHGDLKGNNIVVSDNGTAVLTDFGLSFLESGPCSVKKMKDTLGVMQWRAPEFAKITVETPTRKSDVYSFGMCVIQAVNYAEVPWGSSLSSEAIRDILCHGELTVEKPEAMTDAQWRLATRMIAISPNDRPDLVELLKALDQFAEAEMMKSSIESTLTKQT